MGAFHLVPGGIDRYEAPNPVGPGALRLGCQRCSCGEPGSGEIPLRAQLIHLPCDPAGRHLELSDVRLRPRQLRSERARPAFLSLQVCTEDVLRALVTSGAGPIGAVTQRSTHLLDPRQLASQPRPDSQQRCSRPPELGRLGREIGHEVVVGGDRIRRGSRTPSEPSKSHRSPV